MNSLSARFLIGVGITAAAFSASAAPTVLANGVQQLALGGNTGCYQMAIAYDPNNSQYYGGSGGAPSCNGYVWSSAGVLLQNAAPINVDVRGVNYNANNQKIEVVGYGSKSGFSPGSYSGLYEMGRDGAGLYTQSNNLVLAQLSGMADDQSVPSYDAARDVLYSKTAFSNLVNVTSHGAGNLLSTITLTGASVANTVLYAVAYDAVNDALIEFDNNTNQALVFDITGAFIGASQLSGGPYDHGYDVSYANGLLFVGNGNLDGYHGFQIFGAAANVPEPAALALTLAGLLATAGARRRRV